MKYSQLYFKGRKEAKTQDSINATLLTRAGYIEQTASGVYSLLPLGLMVVKKIEDVVRREMNATGAAEMLMSSLSPKDLWVKTGRYDDKNLLEILYQDENTNMVFSPSHEEVITDIVTHFVQSYQDLPIKLYQFQTKFRKELRPRGGLLRGREFLMKDLYSFHTDVNDLNDYYEQVVDAYMSAYRAFGLDPYRVKASGGIFGDQYSDEFQILCDAGEDEIYYNEEDKTGFNKEVEESIPAEMKEKLKFAKGIEAGNIFKLGTKYADALGLSYLNREGVNSKIQMASYGLGISRLMGILVEVNNDENGIIWPKAASPFDIYAIDLTDGKGEAVIADLEKAGLSVLEDDRDTSAGQKFVESDLLGFTNRLVISEKTLAEDSVEVKERRSGKVELIKISDCIEYFKSL